MRTIIVDPQPERMEATSLLLSSLGHSIVALVGDGVWAVSFCKRHKPDLAVLDHALPQLSCEGVIRALRQYGTARYIIVGQEEQARPYRRLYGDPHIVAVRRPFTNENLSHTIALMRRTPALLPDWGMTRAEDLPHRYSK